MKIITINQFYFNKNFGDILKSNNNEIQDNKLDVDLIFSD